MKNLFRVWDVHDKLMIYPEDEQKRAKSEWPSLLAVGLHGLPIAIDRDSVRTHEIFGWNVDHNRMLMRATDLKDEEGKMVYAGDLRIYGGKLYKVVDDGWRFRLERNLVEFGENDIIQIGEDEAWESRLVGNIYEDSRLLLNGES